MSKQRNRPPFVKWIIGATVLVVGTVATVALAPGNANASCGPGQTCAVFENADGEEFEVCGTGFYLDELSTFEIRDEAQSTIRYFEVVQP